MGSLENIDASPLARKAHAHDMLAVFVEEELAAERLTAGVGVKELTGAEAQLESAHTLAAAEPALAAAAAVAADVVRAAAVVAPADALAALLAALDALGARRRGGARRC
jgi:hypothetical protein